MKELLIQVQESEYAFVAKLLQQFSFVKIKEKKIIRRPIRRSQQRPRFLTYFHPKPLTN